MGRVHAPQPHQRRHDRNPERFRQRAHLRARLPLDDASAHVHQGSPALPEHREELPAPVFSERVGVDAFHPVPVPRYRQSALAMEGALPVLHVFGHVHHHRARPPRAGDLERRPDGRLELLRISHQKHVLGDGAHDRGHGCFLERVGADGFGGHLPADDDDRYRVRHAVPYRCDAVRRSRTRGHHHHADPSTRPREARGHEPGTLLVGRNDERHRLDAALDVFRVVAEHRVIGWQDRAATVPEDGLHPLVREHVHDDVRAAHDAARGGIRLTGLGSSLCVHGAGRSTRPWPIAIGTAPTRLLHFAVVPRRTHRNATHHLHSPG